VILQHYLLQQANIKKKRMGIFMDYINELVERYPVLNSCKADIENALKLLIDCFKSGGKIMLCGNGGSAADCDHIVGELMKGFLKKRALLDEKKNLMKANNPCIDDDLLNNLQAGLPAISLFGATSLISAFANDVNSNYIFAQQVLNISKENDILLCISTSGNAQNVCAAAEVAISLGIKIISLTGNTGGKLKDISTVSIIAPHNETYIIQELHLPIYHCLCASLEEYFF
jgi:D-sedoheptulose 7-phosphate isomerase